MPRSADLTRIALKLSYDGSGFHGWQRQTDGSQTIQENLENAISRIANQRVNVVASGRTDTGVHARVQIAHVDVPKEFAEKMLARPKEHRLSMNRLELALNGATMLPGRVRVHEAILAPKGFHAQRSVKKKTYVYFIDPSPVQWPHHRKYAWSLRLPLDVPAMQRAAKFLQGKHDFKAFCASDSSAKTTVRTIHEASVGFAEVGGVVPVKMIAFRFTGSGFLKQQVRSMVGTLVMIANGRAKPELVRDLLKSGMRSGVGHTAPPHGLWLWDILY